MVAAVSGEGLSFDVSAPLIIVGGGCAGLTAALAAHDAGLVPLVLERDAFLRGSTSLSSGLIPAACSRLQKAAGVADDPVMFASDIERKAGSGNDPVMVDFLTRESGPAIDWLADQHGLKLEFVGTYTYPGHSAARMHGPKDRRGATLMAELHAAASRAGIDIVTRAYVRDLFVDADNKVIGIAIERPNGSVQLIGCQAVILACNGFGSNQRLVRRFIPEMADAQFVGHANNEGEAVIWGEALDAGLARMGSYQGHGAVADPQNIIITWALMLEGGFQVNLDGGRFANEQGDYSQHAIAVLRQPGGVAFSIFDERIHRIGIEFEDYRNAVRAGAISVADRPQDLADMLDLPQDAFVETLRQVALMQAGLARDSFGRDFTKRPPLSPPFYGIRVTGALFHTQGGLRVDTDGRVERADGRKLPNLFAAGGAAAGVSGDRSSGYLSGNGLLSAIVLGRSAGRAAAALALNSLNAG